jgi:hypothetical protein
VPDFAWASCLRCSLHKFNVGLYSTKIKTPSGLLVTPCCLSDD